MLYVLLAVAAMGLIAYLATIVTYQLVLAIHNRLYLPRRNEDGFSVTTEQLAIATLVVLVLMVTFLPLVRSTVTTVWNDAVNQITGAS